jgi:hypothetical protein
VDRLSEAGIRPIPPGIRTGSGGTEVAFFHPRDCGGVLVELSAPAANGGNDPA